MFRQLKLVSGVGESSAEVWSVDGKNEGGKTGGLGANH
jgi:hypothetical protein